MIRYYREDTGDYLAVNHSSPIHFGQGQWSHSARATALTKVISSVSTTSVHPTFLRKYCKAIAVRDVPIKWVKALGYEEVDLG